MIVSGGALALALALVAAQGPRAAGKRKRPPPPATSVPAEKRVVAPVRVHPSPSPSPSPRGDAAPGGGRRADTAGAGTVPGDRGDMQPADADGQTGGATIKPAKTKTYTFGAMDVEGKLKTPQLLYFLNRVKLELEMSAPDHRSFMKELERTADDPNL
ncbi:MAG: hypothetical protein ABUS79_07100 [Pseudomonadota bacterium]